MDLNSFLNLWFAAGGQALGISLVSSPVTSIRGEDIFPPGLPREVLFASLPLAVGREFFIQDASGKLARVVFSILIEEKK